ncbi:hypothetical protein BGZ46_003824 [Entomortierella lignicola]|nr:hypothetical protein BGZ46_003824 [Entomortierella lignicola]
MNPQNNKTTFSIDSSEQQQQHHQQEHRLQSQYERKTILSSSPNYTQIRKMSEESLVKIKPTAYENILKQIAVQRAKLGALQTGAQALSEDVVALGVTLGEEHGSMNTVFQDAHIAIRGWQDTWNDYSRCEPLQALQDQPNVLAMLIQSMSWANKKDLFEQIVASCRPRETYQLQRQISSHYGQVSGFDLLKEFPFVISKLVMTNLNFIDLANCRMVSRNWRHAATAYDVISSAVKRLTFASDLVSLESVDESKMNWNQLCRYHERNFRWIKCKPASLHAMLGHTSYVTSLKSRGGWVVSGGYDEKVRLWEAATGKCAKIWEMDSAVSCVELFVNPSMDGGGVVVAAFVDIGLVKVWSLHGPLNMHTLTGHQKGVRALAINEAYLVTAGFDQTVLVWDWSTGRKIANFRAHNEVILGVHLSNNTVYTFCIDATLRVFDIPSRTLLYQTKLFEVRSGASLQWSCLQGRMLLTATSKKIYVWQLEHLERPVYQQQQQQLSFRSSVASADSSDNSSTNSSTVAGPDGKNTNLGIGRKSRSRLRSSRSSRSRSISPSYVVVTPPRTPSSTAFPSSNSSYFYDSTFGSSSTLSLSRETPNGFGIFPSTIETNVKPCLTAVLNMTIDMWCGKATHHDPPMLILGSRSSPVKLVALELTRDIIDPGKIYDSNNTPLLLSPKSTPIQGMPVGHGRGIMCIDSDTNKLVVGCTGGSIHAFYMDPAKRSLDMGKLNTSTPLVINLPHHSPTQTDSIPSLSLGNPTTPTTSSMSTVSPSQRTRTSSHIQPKKAISCMTTPTTSRTNPYGLPTPESSPQLPRVISGSSPTGRRAMKVTLLPSPPLGFEEQEVLVDCEEDTIHVVQSKRAAVQTSVETRSRSSSNPIFSKKNTQSSPPRIGSQWTKTTASSSTLHTLSSLSKFIPGPTSKIMMRRRATSAAESGQLTDTAVNTITTTTIAVSSSDALSPADQIPNVSILKGRSQFDTSLLSNTKSSTVRSTQKPLSKSWSLSSPWTNSLRCSSKRKAFNT